MKTYELNNGTSSTFIKTEAGSDQIQKAIDFTKLGAEPTVEKLLQALRVMGFKATEVKLEPVEIFEF